VRLDGQDIACGEMHSYRSIACCRFFVADSAGVACFAFTLHWSYLVLPCFALVASIRLLYLLGFACFAVLGLL
jgi:hypothetical protein